MPYICVIKFENKCYVEFILGSDQDANLQRHLLVGDAATNGDCRGTFATRYFVAYRLQIYHAELFVLFRPWLFFNKSFARMMLVLCIIFAVCLTSPTGTLSRASQRLIFYYRHSPVIFQLLYSPHPL